MMQYHRKTLIRVSLLLLSVYTGACWSEQSAASTGHDHAAHRAAMQTSRYAIKQVNYAVPDVQLLNESGTTVRLQSLLDLDQSVALNFIFTTCTTICPVMTATFAQMRRELGATADQVQFVSITIDPEYDRPDILKTYAAQFGASAGWTFLTGKGTDIAQVLHSFNTYAGSKMNHQPVTLLKAAGSSEWTRIDGLASGRDLADEVTTRLLN